MKTRRPLILGFAGDLMLGGEPVRHAERRGWEAIYPFEALRSTLQALDVLFVNLEGPLFADRACAMRKPLLLANHPEVVEVLKLPHRCVCSLANNHSLDFGVDALLKTQTRLETSGISHVGAGRNAAEAERELILEEGGWRIGCLAFAARDRNVRSVIAGSSQPGCASLHDRVRILQKVRRLRKQVDLVIVMLHWGLEFHEYPSPAQVRLAHALVDAGAHVIAGHHPHAVQAVENYKGAVIAYSLGHLFMPPFRLPQSEPLNRENAAAHTDGPVFYPRPASKEFVLMRMALPADFPLAPGAVDVVAGGMDAEFRLRPYNRIALKTFRDRLDNLGCPLRNGSYGTFWRQYRAWRGRELEAWSQWPTAEESFVRGSAVSPRARPAEQRNQQSKTKNEREPMNHQFDSPRERAGSFASSRRPGFLSRGEPAKGMAQSVTRRRATVTTAGRRSKTHLAKYQCAMWRL